MQQRSADFTGHRGELEGPFADPRECQIHVTDEPLAKSGSFRFVPPRRILEIGLGKWFDSATAIELLA